VGEPVAIGGIVEEVNEAPLGRNVPAGMDEGINVPAQHPSVGGVPLMGEGEREQHGIRQHERHARQVFAEIVIQLGIGPDVDAEQQDGRAETDPHRHSDGDECLGATV
jgi:hypothetical protein